MTTPQSPDDELIGWLARVAARADPVPEPLLDAARAAFGLRELDVRVAELVRDSAVDAPATVVRGTGPRLLSFEAGEIVIECEVRTHTTRRDLIGQLVGATATSVTAQVATTAKGPGYRPTASARAPVDEYGRFSLRGLPGGVLRLRCQLTDGTMIVTSWTAV